MAAKNRKIIRLLSTGTTKLGKLTGYCYTTYKSNKYTEKLNFRKFDPRAHNPESGKRGMHVLFKEAKIK